MEEKEEERRKAAVRESPVPEMKGALLPGDCRAVAPAAAAMAMLLPEVPLPLLLRPPPPAPPPRLHSHPRSRPCLPG